MDSKEIVRIDGSGKDPAVGIMGAGNILQALEREAFQRGWGRITVDMPVVLMQSLTFGSLEAQLSRVSTGDRNGLRWRASTRDIDILPVKGKPLINVFSDNELVATVDYNGRDPETATAAV